MDERDPARADATDDEPVAPSSDARVVDDDDIDTSPMPFWDVWADGPVDKKLSRLPSVAWAAVRFVWRADRASFGITLANNALAGVVSAVQVLVVGAMLSRLLGGAAPAQAARAAGPWVVALVIASAVSSVMNAFVRGRADLFNERVGQATTSHLLAVTSNVDLLAFESPAFQDRLQRVQGQANYRPMQVVQSLTTMLSGLAGCIGVLVALAVLQPWTIPLVFLAYLPVAIAMNRSAWTEYEFVRTMTPLERRRSYVSTLLSERGHAKEVRAFKLRPFLLERYGELWEQRQGELAGVVKRKTRLIMRAELASALLTGVVMASLLALLGNGRLSVAAAGAVLNGLLQLRARFGGITYGASGLYEAVLFLQDQRALLDQASALEQRRPTDEAPSAFERLGVDHVSFRYPGAARDALQDVSLEIASGEVIALVGENGSGKTTLAKLLGHLYPPSQGRITWDGVDLAGVEPDGVRRAITVVFQDFARYNLSAAENIALGDAERRGDRTEIEVAAQHSGADGFITRLADGYDTLLGRMFETGHDLSVGQWQRVAVARAFFRDAPFVILDEPTASLDARAESELFDRIRSLFVGRTVLLISHRFSTVRTADRIYVLHAGRVEEHGTHDELLALGGRYAELFTLQARAFVDADVDAASRRSSV